MLFAATLVTKQLVFNGVMTGMVFGLVAMGIVLIYRSTRVINFAVTGLGLVGAGLFALLVVQYGVPFWLAAVISLVAGTLYGGIVELAVIRRLFTAPRVIVLVATIGIAGLSQAILLLYPEIDAPAARFPVPIGSVREIGGVRITGPQLAILIVVPLVAVLFTWMLNRTTLGKTVKASADNPDLARLSGISPKVVSTAVWAIAGALATLSLALLSGDAGSVGNLEELGPSTLVRALAAAVIAGMYSFRRAFLAGIAIGVIEAVVRFNYLDSPGLMDFLVLIAVLIAVNWQSRQGAGETQTFSFTAKVRPIPERLRGVWWVRQIDRAGLLAMGLVAIVLPFVITAPSRHLLYTTILAFGLCALSLTVLTGWGGQLSLGQMAFAGLGALLMAAFTRGVNFDIRIADVRIYKAGIEPLTFITSVVLAVAITAGVAALIGASALRVRGLYLAVSTFAFGLAAQQWLYNRPLLSGGFNDSIPFRRTDIFGIDLTSQRSIYFLTLIFLVIAIGLVAHLRNTGVGRTTIAVRDNPESAAAYTISPTRTKLRAFALAGGLAALGGTMIAANIQSVPTTRFFTVADSLLLVAIVVIGGLGSVAGAVLGAIWVIGLPAFFPDNDVVPLLTSSVGLLVLLLYFPGGLVQIGHAAREAILSWAERRQGEAPAKQQHAVPVPPVRAERTPLPEGVPALAVRQVVVKFGGILAVDHASIDVHDNEIVGLIGTNGAGKSTLMNAIGGFVPYQGQVEVLGRAIPRRWSPANRASLGLGRTFQSATLFPELTVRETVLVALEARKHTGMVASAVFWPPAIKQERTRRSEADEIIDFLGLGRYADSFIQDLSTGTRRIVELAGLLALDARVLCLDEPTAGVAQRETEAFGPLIKEIRRELGAAMLVIEHDMPLIMSISDRVYCLELGRIIAEGIPADVRSDPAVIASYLGTDERAIARSGAAAEPSSSSTSSSPTS